VKLGYVLGELHRAEKLLEADLRRTADRHRAEHEVHHVARDLATWSAAHARDIAGAGRAHGVTFDVLAPDPRPAAHPDPGLALLADLRRLHHRAAEVSLDWELLAQGAQAAKDTALLDLATRCHPQTLRQLKWTNATLKALSPQILTS
jgi:hypothetical protein